MTTWGTSYGVRINGQMTWFDDYAQAAEIEAAQLYGQVRRKLEAGGMVILVGSQVTQYQGAARRSATNTTPSQNAN